MATERDAEIEQICQAALDCEPSARATFVHDACRGDISLEQEVAALLTHATHADRFLATPAGVSLLDPAPPRLSSGHRLSHYQIIEAIGAGGMGVVYRARDEQLHRDVAIKMLAPATVGDAVARSGLLREARAAAALNHPRICTVYEVGEGGGETAFLAMELVDGQSLSARLAAGPLPPERVLECALQLADAVAHAHRRGVIHRDLKSANVMITPDGQIKVLDFGLAKRLPERALADATQTPTSPTQPGVVMGTLAYMAPELLRGHQADASSDVWALGVVLYEMASGGRPFQGQTTFELTSAILTDPLPALPGTVSPELRRVIEHCLVKSPPDASRRDAVVRYASAVELHRDLAAIQAKPAAPRRTTLTRAAGIGVGLAIVLAAVAFGWLWRRSTRDRWVHETATPEIARLVEAGEFAKAVALVREARAVLPKDPTLEKFWVLATDDWSIDSDPGGAAVSMRPYRGDPDAWEPVGVAPLKHARIPKDVHVLRLTASGFAPLLVITGYGAAAIPPGVHGTFSAKWKLRPAERVPADMVAVPAGFAVLGFPYNMVAAPVDGFLIDRHEVSNEEYKKFVDARGYDRREFWKERFVRDGREIPWEQAMSSFRDATGRPGPSTWQVGSYAKGSERHPVAGVSWYEAAAYAEFAGKSLPTAYQWTVASESAYAPSAIAEGGNFRGSGTQPVGRPGTLSGFGTTDMAGNVKEWCLNEGQDGNRFILGGGFGDQTYQFAFTDEQPPWRRDANFGVRGVTLDAPLPAAALAKINSVSRDFSREKPLSDDVFRAYLRLYTYDKGELHARTEETETTDQWTREKVSFDAAYGNERVIAQVFLPKKVSPPFQAVVYFPGGFAMFDDKLDLANVENGLDYYMKSGRALIVPIYQSTYERRHGAAPDGLPPGLYRDVMIMWSKDLGRTLDYLETRKDIDGTRFAYAGLSLGAQVAPVLLAVEERFKAAILTSGGLMLRRDLAEVDRINFVTHVKTPVLMLNGRYDGEFPVESSQLPLFRRLGTPAKDKKHVVYEAGHANLPHAEEVRETLDWLDKYLGPVRH